MARCKICRNEFVKYSMSQKICRSEECAIAWGLKEREKRLAKVAKEERAKTRLAKQALKTRSEHLKEVEAECNGYVRLRDLKAGYGCISCGKMHSYPRWQAGHLLSVGSHPHLRFNLDNIHLQCVYCNMHKSGNVLRYRKALIKRIGLERVEALESDNSSPKWTIPELVEMKKQFMRMKKELENEQAPLS